MQVLFWGFCLWSTRTKSTDVFCRNLLYPEPWCQKSVKQLVVLVIPPQIPIFCAVIILALWTQNNALSLCGLVAYIEHMRRRNTLLCGWEDGDERAICSGSLMGWLQWGMRCQVRPHGHWDRSHLPKWDSAWHGKDRSVRAMCVCWGLVSAIGLSVRRGHGKVGGRATLPG